MASETTHKYFPSMLNFIRNINTNYLHEYFFEEVKKVIWRSLRYILDVLSMQVSFVSSLLTTIMSKRHFQQQFYA